jgi:hypothetical protein
VNPFEIAILRIVIKRQKPLSISSVIEGFPSGSEDFVLQAINDLVRAGYIRYLYVEKMDHITYNKDKRKEILTIIDPLPELGTEIQEEWLDSKKELTHTHSTTSKKNNDNGRWHYYTYNTQQHICKAALVMSMIVIGVVSIFSTAIPTADVYQDFRLSGSDYYYHSKNNHHLSYSPHVVMSENSTKNYNGFYSPEYLKDQNSNSFMTQTSLHHKCDQELSS